MKNSPNNPLADLGFAQNEAKIYETLVLHNELSVSSIARESGVNRRNVYDTLAKLVDKGFVFQVRGHNEAIYRAVNPQKLTEMLEEKHVTLTDSITALSKQYEVTPRNEEVYIYHGIEGYKNFMREILMLGEPLYGIGGKAQFLEPRIEGFIEYFFEEAEKLGIEMFIIFDHDVDLDPNKIHPIILKNARVFPKEYSTPSTMNIYGDRVVTLDGKHGPIVNERASSTVIKNQTIADSFRVWFEGLYQLAEPIKK